MFSGECVIFVTGLGPASPNPAAGSQPESGESGPAQWAATIATGADTGRVS